MFVPRDWALIMFKQIRNLLRAVITTSLPLFLIIFAYCYVNVSAWCDHHPLILEVAAIVTPRILAGRDSNQRVLTCCHQSSSSKNVTSNQEKLLLLPPPFHRHWDYVHRALTLHLLQELVQISSSTALAHCITFYLSLHQVFDTWYLCILPLICLYIYWILSHRFRPYACLLSFFFTSRQLFRTCAGVGRYLTSRQLVSGTRSLTNALSLTFDLNQSRNLLVKCSKEWISIVYVLFCSPSLEYLILIKFLELKSFKLRDGRIRHLRYLFFCNDLTVFLSETLHVLFQVIGLLLYTGVFIPIIVIHATIAIFLQCVWRIVLSSLQCLGKVRNIITERFRNNEENEISQQIFRVNLARM
jgi:hypothetical protein